MVNVMSMYCSGQHSYCRTLRVAGTPAGMQRLLIKATGKSNRNKYENPGCFIKYNNDSSTDEIPFAALLVGRQVDLVGDGRQVDLVAVVRPRSELHETFLVVEGEPADVDGAGGDEEPERYPRALAVGVDDDIRRELAVDVFVGTGRATDNHFRLTSLANKYSTEYRIGCWNK